MAATPRTVARSFSEPKNASRTSASASAACVAVLASTLAWSAQACATLGQWRPTCACRRPPAAAAPATRACHHSRSCASRAFSMSTEAKSTSDGSSSSSPRLPSTAAAAGAPRASARRAATARVDSWPWGDDVDRHPLTVSSDASVCCSVRIRSRHTIASSSLSSIMAARFSASSASSSSSVTRCRSHARASTSRSARMSASRKCNSGP
mmetsp:Transcript_26381/g.84923  ORF Transcript_26381/g.84923 Transcript_26381/m.84923 type:complete len:209 (-) Transcript_26381:352-978(-)